MSNLTKEEFLLALGSSNENYGSISTVRNNLQESLSNVSSETGSVNLTEPLSKLVQQFTSSTGFENPSYEGDVCNRLIVTSGVLPSDNPVMAPKKRRISSPFPAYLRRRGSNVITDVAVTALQSDSTRNLQPYSSFEAFPRLENYSKHRGATRNLRCETISDEEKAKHRHSIQLDQQTICSEKFGWFEGVFVRTCVNLLGVMLFMRMGWMAGEAGIVVALAQIVLATAITCLTTLSMNALCTNGDIGAGGIYSMISRSLGPEAGAVIGIIFAFTNAAFVGLNLIGAAEAVVKVLAHFDLSMTNTIVNDIRIIGILFLFLIAVIPIISLQLEAKTQSFFLILLVICILDYFIGALIPPNLDQQAKGFIGWSLSVSQSNLWPKWDGVGVNFFYVFGVFFPSVTPIFTGACMSGDLKNPASAIPKGTFLSIAATSITYAMFIIFLGCTFASYASGNIEDIGWNNLTCSTANGECPYGLVNDYNTVAISSALTHVGMSIEPFIYTGILAASLSSALGCYMAAPRIFQSFAEDRLLPYINWFAKGYGPANDPRRGYLLTFIVAVIFTLIGDLNQIAPYISNFYLASYFLVNITCFHAAWVATPSFRPSFRYFNKWISLISGIVCFAMMFLLDWASAIISVALMTSIWLYMAKNSPEVDWGTTSEAQLFNLAHGSALKLSASSDHVKNYRPKILLLTGNPSARPALVDMAANLTKDGMLFLAHIKEGQTTYEQRLSAIEAQNNWLRARKIKGFYVLNEAKSLFEGVKNIAQVTGLGRLSPNIVMLGYKTNWHECKETDVWDYFNIICYAFEMKFSTIIFRVQEGFDFSDFFTSTEENFNEEIKETKLKSIPKNLEVIEETDSANATVRSFKEFLTSAVKCQTVGKRGTCINEQMSKEHPKIPKAVINTVNQFQYVQAAGTIDVWWLYDTGGIAILVSWILRNNNLWRYNKIRVFTVIRDTAEIETTKCNLINLLEKFRIPFSDVTVLSDSSPPSEETKLQFRDVITDWMDESESLRLKNFNYSSMKITKSQLIALKDLTNRHIRLRELLLQYSASATIILMSLPIPKKDVCSAPLYMSWLEMLTQNMPPMLLIRGNQTNVLTFYC